jgi:hypothetical protein
MAGRTRRCIDFADRHRSMRPRATPATRSESIAMAWTSPPSSSSSKLAVQPGPELLHGDALRLGDPKIDAAGSTNVS